MLDAGVAWLQVRHINKTFYLSILYVIYTTMYRDIGYLQLGNIGYLQLGNPSKKSVEYSKLGSDPPYGRKCGKFPKKNSKKG